MVPDQTNNLAFDLALKSEDRIHACSRVRAAVDVVAKKHERVAWAALTSNLIEDVVQGGKVAVDVTYRNRGHADWRDLLGCSLRRLTSNVRLQPRRLMIVPAAAGCKPC